MAFSIFYVLENEELSPFNILEGYRLNAHFVGNVGGTPTSKLGRYPSKP